MRFADSNLNGYIQGKKYLWKREKPADYAGFSLFEINDI
jgi:hypothetical protein